MLSLASVRYKFDGMHMYGDSLYLPLATVEELEKAKVFEFRRDDVVIATFPKSGTTWLIEIVWLLLNNCDVDKLKSLSMWDVSLFLEFIRPPDRVSKNEFPSPRIFKTHLKQPDLDSPIRNHHPKVVVVLRNPKDALVSFYHFYQGKVQLGPFPGTWDEFFEMFKNKELVWGFWFDHVKAWWKQHGKANYHFVKYEEMKKHPFDTIHEIARFLNVELTHDQIHLIVEHTSFENMKGVLAKRLDKDLKLDVTSFIRKGVVGGWKNYFSKEQSDFVDKLCVELKEEGLEFDFE